MTLAAPRAPMRPCDFAQIRPALPDSLARCSLAWARLSASASAVHSSTHSSFTADKPNEELYSTTSRSTPDGLNSLPRDYTGPLLGPPLPGDLGRPILNAQNSGQDRKSTRLNSSH